MSRLSSARSPRVLRRRWASGVSLGALLLLSCDPAVGSDAGPREVDAGPDVQCADLPAPMVGGTTETDALANAPARCGQPEHVWVRGDALGAVVEVGTPTRYTRTTLQGLAEGQGVILPRPIGSGVEVRSIRYTTQDRGALVDSTAIVAYPFDRDPGAPLDALLFPHGTSGFTTGCGPTQDIGAQLLSAVFASFGYMVVAPDYLGLENGEPTYGALHPYLVGQATAIASIDALRAAMRISPDERGQSCATPRFLTIGGSQGGHAALWVDRLAPYYARELEQVGVVATVPPADLFGQIERGVLEFVDASANSAAFFATAPSWYAADDRLAEVLESPYDVDLPAALAVECSPNEFDEITTLEEVFAGPLRAAAAGGTLADYAPWGCFLTENGLTTTSVPRLAGDAPSYGILFVTGDADELVNTPIERQAFADLCAAGLPITYLECAGGSHGGTTLWALPEILDFTQARFAGEAFEAPATCEPPAAQRCEATP